jgi:hypothetical protein
MQCWRGLVCAYLISTASLLVSAANGIRELAAMQGANVAYNDSSYDDPGQRAALLAIYAATSGHSWNWVANMTNSAVGLWGTPTLSYCMWFGVGCCQTSPLSSMVTCQGERSIVLLNMDNFGLQGSLPEQLGDLTQLTILSVGQNPQLSGRLPSTMAKLTQLLWLSVLVSHVQGHTRMGTPCMCAHAC